MNYPSIISHPSWRKLVMSAFAVSLALVFSTTFVYAVGLFEVVDPLPNGCIRPTPPGEEAPICCLSGFVYVEGQSVKDATITIADAKGVIGTVYTQHYRGTERNPYYYVDLTKLNIRSLNATQPITPGNVITLTANYNGITTQPVAYTVQPGGQRFNFNLYNSEVRTLNGQNTGVAEVGKFQSISGVATDSEGNLYLWDSGNYRMLVLQPDGNGQWLDREVWQREPSFLPYQVRSNSGIAINPTTDYIYFNDRFKRSIEVYSSYGNLIRSIAAPENVWGMGFDAARNLYVTTLYAGLLKYGPDEQIMTAISETQLVSIIGKSEGSVQNDRQLAVSPQGDVFIARAVPNGVFKFDSNLQPVSYTLQLTSGLPISKPIAMTVDDANTLYVFDHATYKLYAFNATTGTPLNRSWVLFPPGQPTFSSGSGIYLRHVREQSGRGLVYIVSQYDGLILQLSEEGGAPLHTWGGRVRNHGSLSYPEDIAIALDNSLFFVDSWTGRISRMVDDKIVQSWSMEELGLAAGNMPIALTFDHVGKLLVTTDAHKIHRFTYDPINTTLRADVLNWGEHGSELGQFYGESGIATDKNDFVFITEFGNHRIQVLHQEAAPTGFVAITSITVTGVLSQPLGIAVDDRSEQTKIYVSDTGYQHIAQFSFDRFSKQLTYVGVIGSAGTGTGHFGVANHLDVDEEGYLWVADHVGYKVHRINPNDPTNPDNGWKSYGTSLDPAWYAHGIAITKTADLKELLYVGARSYGLISSFTPMAESEPLATIVHCDKGDLLPGETFTCVASGQDGDASNIITHYKWSTASGLSIIKTESQVAIPTTSGATTAGTLGSGLHTLWLQVRGNEGKDNDPTLDWSQPVSMTIYVAPQVPTPRPTGIPTPEPVQLPPTPPTDCPAGWIWTMLLYLDADNKNDGLQLLADYRNRLEQLKTLNHPCVRVAVQIDGPPSTDVTISQTERWLIRHNPSGALPIVAQGGFDIGGSQHATTESAMDDPHTLSDFIKWGQKQSHWGERATPTSHYYLAIADHGNAFQGIAFDHTTDPAGNAYLDAKDLRTALTDPGVQPIDILHLDACSMALLDVAYQVRDQVDYLIASQYIGWSFFAYADYASYINQWTRPADLAKLIVERYATLAEARHLPYTLSALNLARIEPVKTAIDKLAEALTAWVGIDSTARRRRQRLFDEIRNAKEVNSGKYNALFFDSNSNYLNTPRDAYIDLLDFVKRLQEASITEAITNAATKVRDELESPKLAANKLILHQRHSSPIVYLPQPYAKGAAIDLQKASGVSLYYPVEGNDLLSLPQEDGTEITGATIQTSTALTYTRVYSEYIGNQLFDFTTAARWAEFLAATYGAVPTGAPVLETVPPLTVPVPLNNSGVTVDQYYQVEDIDNNGPSAGDRLHFTTQINNQRDSSLTNVVLIQLFDQPVQSPVNSAQFPCIVNNPKQLCQTLGTIGAKINQPVTHIVTLTTNTRPAIQAILYVDGKPLGELTTVNEHRNQLYLPIVLKK